MRWQSGRRSGNVEDRRGQAMPARLTIGGGVGGIVILLLAVVLLGPEKALELLDPNAAGPVAGPQVAAPNPEEEQLADFVSVVLADTEDVWHDQFRRLGNEYREPKLVLFTRAVDSACGQTSAAVGPFYCPSDQTVYIDLSFYEELRSRFRAPGDFAQAYVIAHEVGHHVQNLLGTSDLVHAQRERLSETEFNDLSVRLELQADFLAGVWAHHAQRARQVIEEGDIEEALDAAHAIGDDRLQMQSRGYIAPDSFTHGTSEQRARWFRRGFETGDINQGDTFAARSL